MYDTHHFGVSSNIFRPRKFSGAHQMVPSRLHLHNDCLTNTKMRPKEK